MNQNKKRKIDDAINKQKYNFNLQKTKYEQSYRLINMSDPYEKSPWTFRFDSLFEDIPSIKCEENDSVLSSDTLNKVNSYIDALLQENLCYKKALRTAELIIDNYKEEKIKLLIDIQHLKRNKIVEEQLQQCNKDLQKRLLFAKKQLKITEEKLMKTQFKLDVAFDCLKQKINEVNNCSINILNDTNSPIMKKYSLSHSRKDRIKDRTFQTETQAQESKHKDIEDWLLLQWNKPTKQKIKK